MNGWGQQGDVHADAGGYAPSRRCVAASLRMREEDVLQRSSSCSPAPARGGCWQRSFCRCSALESGCFRLREMEVRCC
jgi:hypothetical protein